MATVKADAVEMAEYTSLHLDDFFFQGSQGKGNFVFSRQRDGCDEQVGQHFAVVGHLVHGILVVGILAVYRAALSAARAQ